MKTQEWRSVDKSKWPRGEWDDEPDKVQWTTAAGLPALIVRGPIGALCGYVGVAEGHRYFGVGYGSCPVRCGGERWTIGDEPRCDHDAPDAILTVHGGLTFSDFCQPHAEGTGICHTPDVGEPERVWWLGFDCAHGGDVCPTYDFASRYRGHDTYKNIAYVKAEVESLAQQLTLSTETKELADVIR